MSSEPRAEPRIRDGMRAALPLAPSPILFGLSYGVLADATGFGAAAAVVMSATTFAGAAQFASLSVLDAGGTIAAAVLAAVFLNARYVAISVTVASIFPGSKLRRLVESQSIVDESWALSGRRGRFEWPILVGSGIVFYVLWVVSTAAGTAVGGILEDPNALGLDAAFAALFLALAVPYLREPRARQAAALAARHHSRAHPLHARRRADHRGVPCLPYWLTASVGHARPIPSSLVVTTAWIVVAIVGVATIAFKAAGPVLIGRRALPPRIQSLVELLAPVMLIALVVTQTFGGDEEITVDARVVGVGAAGVAIWLRAHVIVAMAVAAAVTAGVRLIA